MVRPVGYNESTTVRIHSKCQCGCGSTRRCHESGRSPSEGAQVDCSSRGVCECGRCTCEHSRLGTIYGKYCESDDFSCSYKDGLLCAGEFLTGTLSFSTQKCTFKSNENNAKDTTVIKMVLCLFPTGRGACVLGECVCEDNWTGDTLPAEEPVAHKRPLPGVPAEVSLQVGRLAVHFPASGDVAVVRGPAPRARRAVTEALRLPTVGAVASGSARVATRGGARRCRRGERRAPPAGGTGGGGLRVGWPEAIEQVLRAGEEMLNGAGVELRGAVAAQR
uniref:Integrin beta epidermal growth factor-like domain-containing protein n=1 Tax=Hippocampus comes TaxID=109280 RepID=A0A3Q2YX32_HIPCM